MDGKKGKLEGKVDIKREGGKVTIEASGATTYAKRYFKYLTKKYLKKCVRGRGGWRSEARAPRVCCGAPAQRPCARARAAALSPIRRQQLRDYLRVLAAPNNKVRARALGRREARSLHLPCARPSFNYLLFFPACAPLRRSATSCDISRWPRRRTTRKNPALEICAQNAGIVQARAPA